jgi:hypothetical protein
MSSGGLSQLVAIGAQDAFITGNPEVSFFQSTYKRHTNFAQVIDRQMIQGTPTPGGMSTIRFERRGDLLGFVYLVANDGTKTLAPEDWTALIDSAELYIGGQLIDRQDSNFTERIAPYVFSQNISKSTLGGGHSGPGATSSFYPFRFWFCENMQSALPLVGLQYHDVEIRIYWGSTFTFTPSGTTTPQTAIGWDAYSQYVFLDQSEREHVMTKTQTMLITQVQKMPASGFKTQEIVFNHPIKYLVAAPIDPAASALTSESNKIVVQINGTDIGDYKFAAPNYTDVMLYYFSPFTLTDNSVFLFPFCLDVSKLQPTGSLNFSRLDSVRIVSQSLAITDVIYGVNYNILRVEKGQAGLMYTN